MTNLTSEAEKELLDNIRVGSVVSNRTGGCAFVVEKFDLKICQDNPWNYLFIHNKFLDKTENMWGIQVGDFVYYKKLFFRRQYKVMRDPSNGLMALVDAPYCLACHKPVIYLANIKYKNHFLKMNNKFPEI